jgi:hypothetical protein
VVAAKVEADDRLAFDMPDMDDAVWVRGPRLTRQCDVEVGVALNGQTWGSAKALFKCEAAKKK